jgi:hypothetical protein
MSAKSRMELECTGGTNKNKHTRKKTHMQCNSMHDTYTHNQHTYCMHNTQHIHDAASLHALVWSCFLHLQSLYLCRCRCTSAWCSPPRTYKRQVDSVSLISVAARIACCHAWHSFPLTRLSLLFRHDDGCAWARSEHPPHHPPKLLSEQRRKGLDSAWSRVNAIVVWSRCHSTAQQ